MKTRRTFLTQSVAVTTGFGALKLFLSNGHAQGVAEEKAFSYGPLVEDPKGPARSSEGLCLPDHFPDR
jgi:hypothetical protein